MYSFKSSVHCLIKLKMTLRQLSNYQAIKQSSNLVRSLIKFNDLEAITKELKALITR